MKLRVRWKYLYWFVIVAFLTFLMLRRLSSFLSGNPTNMDIIVFIIWITLLIVPMFREVNIFGVGLKNEIDSLRNDFRGEMLNLRSEIQNTNIFSPQINVGQPPSDSELPRLTEAIQKAFKDMGGTINIQAIQTEEELLTPANTQYLFSVRYNLEKELNRVWRQHTASQSEKYPRSPGELMRLLYMRGTIDMDFFEALRDVYAVCNMAIHGMDVSQAKVNFVRDVAPQLLVYLESLPISRPKADI